MLKAIFIKKYQKIAAPNPSEGFWGSFLLFAIIVLIL